MKSYKDLPRILYHIQWKFRDEIRPRFGVMRGREFLMKDSYSFDLTVEDARKSYNKMFVSYLRTFARMGLKSVPMVAETGPIGGNLSHEFIILADTGESEVYCHRDLVRLDPPGADIDYDGDLVGRGRRLHRQIRRDFGEARCRALRARGAGRRIASPRAASRSATSSSSAPNIRKRWAARCKGRAATSCTVQMGSYGIGVSRLVGAIIEASHDDAGIIWPQSVAPFDVGLINVKVGRCRDRCGLRGHLRQAPGGGLERAL